MSPTIAAIRRTWTDATDFDSALSKSLVVLATAVLGFAVSLKLSRLWEQLLGFYSSAVTYSTGMVVFFSVYFLLGRAVTTVRERT